MCPASRTVRPCMLIVAVGLGAAALPERASVAPNTTPATSTASSVPGLPASPGLPYSPGLPTLPGLPAAQDNYTRLTIPVMVNGRGPYPFVVDTGATRSVISRELAETLHLPPGRPVSLHDTAGLQQNPTVHIDRLSVGDRRIDNVEAPVIDEVHLGADGMLGLDTMREERVVMDFMAGRFLSEHSRRAAEDAPGTIIVEGRRRYGQLVLVDAESQGRPIFVILDSGAQNTVGNSALRRMMGARHAKPGQKSSGSVISVTGNQTPADLNEIPQIHLGAITINHVPIAYADLHTFAEFNLEERPAMLLGMDAMRMFARVAVDFQSREVSFDIR